MILIQLTNKLTVYKQSGKLQTGIEFAGYKIMKRLNAWLLYQ